MHPRSFSSVRQLTFAPTCLPARALQELRPRAAPIQSAPLIVGSILDCDVSYGGRDSTGFIAGPQQANRGSALPSGAIVSSDSGHCEPLGHALRPLLGCLTEEKPVEILICL